jgi:hypothetical protein
MDYESKFLRNAGVIHRLYLEGHFSNGVGEAPSILDQKNSFYFLHF